jgi:hypothetical protein
MSNPLATIYSTNPLLKGVRTESDLKALALYNNLALSQDYGPNPQASAPQAQECLCPLAYARMRTAYDLSSGSGNNSQNLTDFSAPLNLQTSPSGTMVEGYATHKYRNAPSRPYQRY